MNEQQSDPGLEGEHFKDSDFERLDEESRLLAEHLFAARPAWRKRAFCDTEEGESQAHLVVQFLAKDEAGFDLELSTYGGELTISTRFWHEHSSTLAGDEAEAHDLEPALAVIDGLLGDRLRVWSTFSAGEWTGSGLLQSARELESLEQKLNPTDCLWVRSHAGLASRWIGSGPRPE